MKIRNNIRSLSYLWLGSLLGSGSSFLLYLILARHLGVEQFGIFSSTLALITVLSLLASIGVSQTWLKNFGIEGWDAKRWLNPSFKLIIISIIIVLLLLIIWAFFGFHDYITRNTLLIMSSFMISQVIIELVCTKFQLEEEYTKLALWQLMPNLIRLTSIASIIFIFSIPTSIMTIVYVYAVISIFTIIIGVYQLIQMKISLNLKGHELKIFNNVTIPKVKEQFSQSWPFALASIFAFIYLQSDIIMVKYISGNTQAGLYNIGFIIITAILIFPTVFYQKFLMAKVHRWANKDFNKFHQAYKLGNIAMLIIGIIVMIMVYILSDYFVPLLFGNQYNDSIILIRTLSLSLPFYFIAYNIGTILLTNEHIKQKVKLMGFVALINIILNLFLIHKFQALGAAISTVTSNAFLVLLYYRYAEKKIFNLKDN